MRIGQGYDAHRFETGRKLVLGGVPIDHPQGLKAHSDGDVLIHALCDALLGGAGLGDIGRYYPDDDAKFAGIDSRLLLRDVVERLHLAGFRISNVDLTLVAQQPRLAPYMESMRGRLAADLQIDVHRVNVKATTTEGMGFIGRAEGIAAQAVALLEE
jgi:2-C-methyl-D-erythritol 2,4-cyclodiphosphate synthase